MLKRKLMRLLFPSSPYWSWVPDRDLTDLCDNLEEQLNLPILQRCVDLLKLPFPRLTGNVAGWCKVFSIPGSNRSELTATRVNDGLQSVEALNAVLVAAGFSYLRVWNRWSWPEGTLPTGILTPVGGYMLVNGITDRAFVYPVRVGLSTTRVGASDTRMGVYEPNHTPDARKVYAIPGTAANIIYVGTDTLGGGAAVAAGNKALLERTILKTFPMDCWVGMMVNYV